MRLKHPLTRIDYERRDDGTVRVFDRKGGEGIFDRYGEWLAGPRRNADPLMCMYVSDGFRQVAGAVHSPISAEQAQEGQQQ